MIPDQRLSCAYCKFFLPYDSKTCEVSSARYSHLSQAPATKSIDIHIRFQFPCAFLLVWTVVNPTFGLAYQTSSDVHLLRDFGRRGRCRHHMSLSFARYTGVQLPPSRKSYDFVESHDTLYQERINRPARPALSSSIS
jgi:hypothetical protein